MRQLWLLRHAKSSWDDPALADHDRPLAPRGQKAARRIGRWAAAHGVAPDLVLCSTAVRAQATLELVAATLDLPHIEIDEGLYHAGASNLLDRLRGVAPEVSEAMLVGHNPGLHELLGVLAPPPPDAFPTGALAGLDLAIDDWQRISGGCGRLEVLVVPRELKG